jgi:hypothetical protein
MSAYTACMNEQAGLATHAGTLLTPIPARPPAEVVRIWQPRPKKLLPRESIAAGVFLVLYLAVYLTAGFAGVNLIEWVWMRVFG